MHVVIFEGSRWGAFAPLTLSRPVFQLLSGASTLLQKQIRHLAPSRLTLWVRPELADYCRTQIAPHLPCPTRVNEPLDHESALLWNGRLVPQERYSASDPSSVMREEDDRGPLLLSAMVTAPGLSQTDVQSRTPAWLDLLKRLARPASGWVVRSLPDLIHGNEKSLVDDVSVLPPKTFMPAGPYHVIGDKTVWIGEGASIGPGVVLDATKGPVVIDAHAIIGANSVLNGPCYVGRHTFIRPLTLLRVGTSLGPYSNVGGEVSNAIILGYSNKAHDGYLGDSYLGEWINLGAGTTTSNLKNTYGEISIELGGGRKIPTGRVKLGVLIGDHSKTAILTRLTTGTYIGYCSMVASPAPPAHFVPSYTFITERGAEPYRLDKAIEVTRKVFSRRERPFTSTDERMFRYVASVAPSIEGT